ncbi:MAG: hypothetical protein JWO38_495 [Gemmataceae bacterium]|nr:hypothetical protein [Gemmataceae bacterium]
MYLIRSFFFVPFCAFCASLRPFLFCLFLAAPCLAAEPTVRNVNVRGLQVGGTTTVVVDGDDLGKAPRLLLPFPAKQTLGPKSTDKQAAFDVALDATVAPGYYHLRVATEGGVSLPVVIGVDKLPQRALAAAPEQLPVALHGAVSGSTIAEATFVGKAGQKVVVEVEAERLGSKLRPVAHLYSAKKIQVAWSWCTPGLLGDTRLEAALPEDGSYTVAVHDAEYTGAAPGFFRLKIGQWSYTDHVFPPVVGKDTKAVELLGPPAPVKVELAAPVGGEVIPLPWPKDGLWSGPRPFVEVSPRTEVVAAAATGEKPTDLPAGPVGVSGRLLKPFAEDRFRVPVTPGTKVRFEVFAERLRSPADVALVVRNEMGAEVVRVEDGPNTLDPVIEYAVPDKVTAVVVGVIDSQGRGGPHAVYRLSVDPVAAIAPADYQLTTPAQRIALPIGGRAIVPVFAERRGYAGRIDLTADPLPAGVKLDGAAILPDADGALVTVVGGGTSGDATVTTWRGRGVNGLVRPVRLKGHPLGKLQPWLATELAVAPTTAKAGEFAVDWRGLADTAGLVPAVKFALPVKVTRTDPNTAVRLTLLTSQLPPLVNNQPDLARTIRPEKPIELAAKVSDGEVVALLPPDLPSPEYDVAIQAELLTPDKQRVLATAFTPVRHLTVRMPIAVKLTSPARIEVKVDPKMPPTFEVKGEVVRSEGFAGDATVTLAGLPPGAQAAPAAVKAGATAFAIKVTLPAATAAGEVKGIKLSATAATDPKQPNVLVKSRDIELTLNIAK